MVNEFVCDGGGFHVGDSVGVDEFCEVVDEHHCVFVAALGECHGPGEVGREELSWSRREDRVQWCALYWLELDFLADVALSEPLFY